MGCVGGCEVKILQRGSNYPQGGRYEIRQITAQACFLRADQETISLTRVQRGIKGEKEGRDGCDLPARGWWDELTLEQQPSDCSVKTVPLSNDISSQTHDAR